jgi:hypothetical protein
MPEQAVGGAVELARQWRTHQHQHRQHCHAEHRPGQRQMRGLHDGLSGKLTDEQGSKRGEHYTFDRDFARRGRSGRFRFVVQHQQAAARAGRHRVGASIIIAEFDQNGFVIESFNDGADLSPREALNRPVREEGDHIEQLQLLAVALICH